MGGKNKNFHDIIYSNNNIVKIGRFVNIHESGNYDKSRHKLYFATCSVCGNIVEKTIDGIRRTSLKCTCDKNTVSVAEDLTNKRFGKLLVICRANDYVDSYGTRYAQWLCQCDCGSDPIVVRGSSLRSKNTLSCGCLKSEKIREVNKKENKKDLSGEFGIIWSTNTNEEIYFDLCDTNKIINYTWYVDAHGYATAHINGKHVKMHVFLGYKWHDHHNRNRLDNRSNNLIFCTTQENNRNKSMRTNNTSGIIGVSWNKNRNKWIANINIQKNQTKRLGYFVNKEDAIKARLIAEAKYYGEFAPQRHLFQEYGIVATNK